MHAGRIFSVKFVPHTETDGQSGDWEGQSVWGLGRLVSLGTGKAGQSGDWEGWSVWGLGRLVSLGTGKTGQSRSHCMITVFNLLLL